MVGGAGRGYMLKGEYVVVVWKGCTFLETKPMGKGGGKCAAENIGSKKVASSKNSRETPEGYGWWSLLIQIKLILA